MNVGKRPQLGAFKGIEDNYPKYVLTMDKFDFSQNGIIHILMNFVKINDIILM